MTAKYNKLIKNRHRLSLKEQEDCAVLAAALVCRTKYETMHRLFKELGRRNRSRTPKFLTLTAVEKSGFKVTSIEPLTQSNGSRYTAKTIGKRLHTGYYLCFVRGHVLAVINGTVEDWSHGRRHIITSAHKVVRPRL